MLNRRDAIALTGLAFCGKLLAGNSGRFWNSKDPANWTPQEIDLLLSDSPWARKPQVWVTGGLPSEHDHRPWSESPPEGVPPGMGIPRKRTRTRWHGVLATVRWASAAPIVAATRSALPDSFADHYALAVVGLPLADYSERQRGDPKGSTLLGAKGRDRVNPDLVEWKLASQTVLFGFSKRTLPLGKAEHEIVFTANLASFEVKATFLLSEMSYRGALAV